MAANEPQLQDLPAGFNWLRDLLTAGSTGVLHLSGRALTDLDVYVMDGQIIACASQADDWLFGRLLKASGTVGGEELELALSDLGNGGLAEVLMRDDLLSMDSLQGIQRECFRNNLVDACVRGWDHHRFESLDAVFPPNMQLGVDADAMLDEAVIWYERVFPLLQMLQRRQDPVFQQTLGGETPGGEASIVLSVIAGAPNLTTILARSPLVPFRTLDGLITLVSAGAVSISMDQTSAENLASMTQELEALPMPREGSDEMPSPVSLSLEPMRAEDVGLDNGPDVLSAAQAAMLADEDPAEAPELEEGSIDGDMLSEPSSDQEAEASADAVDASEEEFLVDADAVGVDDSGEIVSVSDDVPDDEQALDQQPQDDAEDQIDYEAVHAGEHARVYNVLDKVDLSHVEGFPTPEEAEAAPEEVEGIEEVIEAAADHSIELGEDSEVSEVEMLGSDAVDSFDDHLGDVTAPDSGGVAEVDAPPIHLTGTEDSIEFFIDVEDDDQREIEARLDVDAPPANADEVDEQYTDLPYDRGEIASFLRRIEVFNRIFRVVNETFRGPLGDDETIARFNRFLRDDSLQYPDLFTGIDVERGGTIAAAPLLRNLATASPEDPESYLHQGLYELIYVHLYDAKDVLTPEQEQAMMDEISAMEEDLHD